LITKYLRHQYGVNRLLQLLDQKWGLLTQSL